MKAAVNAALIRELNRKGYRGQQMAEWLATMHEEKAAKEGLGFIEGKGDQAILLQMDVHWYLSGGADCIGLRACPLVIAAAELMASGSVGAHPAWLSFEGLPPMTEVKEKVAAQVKKLVAELPKAKTIQHPFQQHIQLKSKGSSSPDQSEELSI